MRMLNHFDGTVEGFQVGDHEKSIAKGGKFIEAVLKVLYIKAGKTLPNERDFKVDKIIIELSQVEKTLAPDAIRLLIPRACRFLYDIASNRGARHDASIIDPNAMDATVMVSVSSWILAELIRLAGGGAIKPDEARILVEGITEKRFPLLETVDGRLYFHKKNSSARDIALVGLWNRSPNRMARSDLRSMIERHGFSKNNADVTITRLKTLVDDDGAGNLRLLSPGIKEAESLILSFDRVP